MGHVVKRLEDGHQVIPAGELGVAGVPVVKRDSILHAAARQQLARGEDRGLVEVDAIDADLGITTGQLEFDE